jgi:heme oxygenase
MLLGDQGVAARTRAGERRFRLKAATDAAHNHVESIVRSARMLDTRAGWLRYLEATFEMRAAAELALDAAHAERVFPAWPTRRLAALVAADILDLGGSCEAAFEPWPEFSDAAELLGALYVLEGSALGARVITGLADRMG